MRGVLLHHAGRLAEAEEALKRATELPALINCRQRVRYELFTVRWDRQRASRQPLTPEQRKQFSAELKAIADMGPRPAPIADAVGAMLTHINENALALAVVEDRQRRAPPDIESLRIRAVAEFGLGSFPRALATTKEILARDPKDDIGLRMQRLAREAI